MWGGGRGERERVGVRSDVIGCANAVQNIKCCSSAVGWRVKAENRMACTEGTGHARILHVITITRCACQGSTVHHDQLCAARGLAGRQAFRHYQVYQ